MTPTELKALCERLWEYANDGHKSNSRDLCRAAAIEIDKWYQLYRGLVGAELERDALQAKLEAMGAELYVAKANVNRLAAQSERQQDERDALRAELADYQMALGDTCTALCVEATETERLRLQVEALRKAAADALEYIEQDSEYPTEIVDPLRAALSAQSAP